MTDDGAKVFPWRGLVRRYCAGCNEPLERKEHDIRDVYICTDVDCRKASQYATALLRRLAYEVETGKKWQQGPRFLTPEQREAHRASNRRWRASKKVDIAA